MKLILHAGSHKTATTSIQHFCAVNRKALEAHGFYYPRNTSSSYVFNFLASDIALGRIDKTTAFLEKVRRDAEVRGCHTVLLSAESFYAMTAFFIDIQKRARAQADYFANEASFVSAFRRGCVGYEAVQAIFYFRPQDDFAASLYNQFVKSVFGISDSYPDFVKKIAPVFDYAGHVALWEECFGCDNVAVRNFLSCKADPVKDFCYAFLGEACYRSAPKTAFLANTRLSRDVLEFKRLLNSRDMDRSYKYLVMRALSNISADFPDRDGGYQVFDCLDNRRTFFAPFEAGNNILMQRYDFAALPVIGKGEEPTYPQLSADVKQQIEAALELAMSKPENRFSLFARRLANRIMDGLPGGRVLLQPVRVATHRLRFLVQGW